MVRECTARDSVELSRLIQMFGNSNTPKETQFLDISAYIENAITRKLITILGLEAEDTLIGYASIVVYQSLTDREANAYLDELFIHPDFQNKGYGSMFLAEIKNWCKDHAVTKLKLVTRPENLQAQEFYKKNLGLRKDKVNYTFEIDYI